MSEDEDDELGWLPKSDEERLFGYSAGRPPSTEAQFLRVLADNAITSLRSLLAEVAGVVEKRVYDPELWARFDSAARELKLAQERARQRIEDLEKPVEKSPGAS